jgi:hypothetical protein
MHERPQTGFVLPEKYLTLKPAKKGLHGGGLPRHLGQHSGGMVICQGQLNKVVPLERASMPGRTVVQWDKEDCADLGIIKVDLLGLGMMAVLKDCQELIPEHYGDKIDLAQLPEDEDVYKVLRQADTVGMFQVESRAQMASLPRNNPKKFYDLVVQVAIIRPGPIVGKMMHPYMRRRQGREEITYGLYGQPDRHECVSPPEDDGAALVSGNPASGVSRLPAFQRRDARCFARSTEDHPRADRICSDGFLHLGRVRRSA